MYAIVLDTNCLQQGVSKDFSRLWATKSLESCCEIIEAMDAHEHFKFLIPEVVLRELRQHQLEAHKNSVNEIRKLKLPSWSFEYDWEGYIEFVDRSIERLRSEKRLGLVPLEIVPLPTTNCIEGLLGRAMDKKPPFCGGKLESDKGFKDALIWESLIEYKRNNLSVNMMLVTGDNLLGSEKLLEEFDAEFGEELVLVKNLTSLCEQVQAVISAMGLGYAIPEFAEEYREVVSVAKSWLFENAERLMKECDVEYCLEGRIKAEIETVEPDVDEKMRVVFSLQFEGRTESEIVFAKLELFVEKREGDEWWLSSFCINDKDIPYNEFL